MPIRPDDRRRYPSDWATISDRAKERAGWKCQWCSRPHQVTVQVFPGGSWVEHDTGRHFDVQGVYLGRRPNHTWPATSREVRTILTTAHLDHQPENCADENLAALCQRCHLNYDKDHHASSRRLNMLRGELRIGQLEMFGANGDAAVVPVAEPVKKGRKRKKVEAP